MKLPRSVDAHRNARTVAGQPTRGLVLFRAPEGDPTWLLSVARVRMGLAFPVAEDAPTAAAGTGLGSAGGDQHGVVRQASSEAFIASRNRSSASFAHGSPPILFDRSKCCRM